MQVQTIQGYFSKGIFYQEGKKADLPENKLLIVNVFDMPPGLDVKTNNKVASDEEIAEFFKLAPVSDDFIHAILEAKKEDYHTRDVSLNAVYD